MINRVLMVLFAAGAVLGGLDRIFKNKLGLGAQFEKALMLLGPMALSMAGMICLAPALASALGCVITPVYSALGVDPGMFGGVLAIDMGGYQLSADLAIDPLVGQYAGIVVSSIFGCTLVFTVPVGMGMISPADRAPFARGVMLGLAAMPVGLIAGGLACGLSLLDTLRQNIPVFVLSLALLLGLWKLPGPMVRGFCALSAGINVLVTAGLTLAAVTSMTGWDPIPSMAPISEAMSVVASIGVVMLGSLPVAELLRRALDRPLRALGSRLGLNTASTAGMLVSLATPLPALSTYGEMDSRGKVVTGAFLVSASSLLAAHTAFTLTVSPALLPPLYISKLTSALASLLLSLLATSKATPGPKSAVKK